MLKNSTLQNRMLFIAVIIFSVSCSNNNSSLTSNEEIVRSNVAKDSLQTRFNIAENIFQNDNWLLIDGKDSSYLYCSRLSKTFVKTYHFNMFKGDSVNTIITSIQLLGDTILWHPPMDTILLLRLKDAKKNKLIWADKTGVNIYSFEKSDSNHIVIKYPGRSSRNLVKTPTLSSFLVRSKYDYLHGTKFAFDTTK